MAGGGVDQNGLTIGWPERSGQLFIINGGKLAIKYWLVEIPFTTPSVLPATINVPIQSNIQGFLLTSFYWSMEAYNATTLTGTPSGNAAIPQANLTASYISLYDNTGFMFWNNKPLRDLQTINDTANTPGKQYVDSLGGQVINWQQSSIYIAKTTGLATSTTYSIVLGFAFSLYANYQQDGVGSKTYNKVAVNN